MDSALKLVAAPEHRVTGEAAPPNRIALRRRGRPTLSDADLLDKALDLFLEHGFSGTSMEAITIAAGVAKRTVYKRYGDKMSLFRAALKQAIDNWILPVERLRALETDDLEESLLAIGHLLIANVTSPAGLRLLRITNAESVRLPEIALYTHREGTERTITYLADLFRRRGGMPPAALAEADLAAEALISLLIGAPAERAAWGRPMDGIVLEQRTRFCVKLFMRGLANGARTAGADLHSPDCADAQRLRELEKENRHLREMLVNAMLEAKSLGATASANKD